MAQSIFDQFMSPIFIHIPLLLVALLAPGILFQSPSQYWSSSRLDTLMEQFMNWFTKQILLPMETNGHIWAAFYASLLIFLLSMNMTGLLPYTFTPTTQLSMNLGLAVPLWLATVLIGLRNQPSASLAHLLPEGTPKPLIPLLIIIETISLFIRPLALAVRLTANLTAGHLLMHLVSSATFVLVSISPLLSLSTAILLMLLTLLEVAVAAIQAYVFVLLLSLYLQENT